ncbi:MAG TPA: cytochrome c biogenesis protein CcdA [Syntrophomonadaceae bacterium]|nr:cytochrome c biogenesis protein CcdA [Syntrophomonadaceae bacterium]HHW29521.1 cytochrome c biogenesis protein CcdA [Syntrophomonadaceae bacterium]
METLMLNFGELLSQNIWLAFVMALLAGLLSSFSPCILSTVPLIIGYVGGFAGDDQKRALKYSLLFCFGLVLTFTTLGAASAILGRMMTGAGKWWYILLALIMAAAGLQLLGIVHFTPQSCRMPARREGLVGAFLLGIIGGVLSSPCATPVLAAILAFVAGEGNIYLGIGLLATYSIGHCLLLLIAGTSVGFVNNLAGSPRTEKWGRVLKGILGVLVIILAFYLFYLGI